MTIGGCPPPHRDAAEAELESHPNRRCYRPLARAVVPSAVQLGIRREGWVASDKQMRFRVAALDLDGKPLARQKIAVALYRSTAYSYRKRLIGGFYTYETLRETTRIPETCEGTTDKQGLLLCEVAPGVSGEDPGPSQRPRGNLAGATLRLGRRHGGEWWFGGTRAIAWTYCRRRRSTKRRVARFKVRCRPRATGAHCRSEGALRASSATSERRRGKAAGGHDLRPTSRLGLGGAGAC